VMRIDEGSDAAGGEAIEPGSESSEPGGESSEPGGESSEPGGESIEPSKNEAAREKVIVRSNGVVTYVGKDIANQFWKFGLLGRDFRYRLFATQADGRPLWATTSGENDPTAPPFGKAQRIYNVIDSRQLYLQALLSQALRTLGHPDEADRSIHFSYEMVALSHATAKELGYPANEDAQKPFVEVSGRKGLGVKIDDLLDLLITKATAEVAKRNPDLPDEERSRTASRIAVAAIRYFMLKFSRGKLIVFDIEEALSFEGETGPYLQYAVVRANNIFNKLQERDGMTAADVLRALDTMPSEELDAQEATDAGTLWSMVFEASRLDEVVDQVVRSLEFSGLAKYTFGLAQMFNAFYHRYPILAEERADRKLWRAAGVAYVRDQLTRALDLMGVEVPIRM
jgi:arginyl-tRNA synthetase